MSVGGWNWFWILNWVIYQGLPSIYNLKARPAASMAGLLTGVFTGPQGGGSPVPLLLNACQRVWSFRHHRWYIPLRRAKNQAEHGTWLPLWQHLCGTRVASQGQTALADMFLYLVFISHHLEHLVLARGVWSNDEERREIIVFVYLKDANHPDPLRALMEWV